MKETKTILEHLRKLFCSVKLAVYTLITLSATSIIGTIILQNGTRDQYVHRYGEAAYNLIKVFDIDDMYQAWWFLGLIVILCINIAVCSIGRLRRTWKIIFKVSFNLERFRRSKASVTFEKKTAFDAFKQRSDLFLTRQVGKTDSKETDKGIAIFVEKGRWTRLGVYIVHASILLLLIGALIGSRYGFKANIQIKEGETSNVAFIANKRTPIQLDFTIKCNDFEVKFYDTGAPEEFRSNLTIIENGKERLTKDIRVNHPLRYKGINIFQSSYGTTRPDSVVLDILKRSDKTMISKKVKAGETITLPDNQGTFKLEGLLPRYDFQEHNLGEALLGTVTPNDKESFQVGLPLKFPSFDKMRKGPFAFLINEFEQRYFTGLQVTKDPGVWYVYAGFILMIIGCWITFFMAHQSFCIEIEKKEQDRLSITMTGITNRNNQGIKRKLKTYLTLLGGK